MKINPTDWVLYKINPIGNKDFINGRVEVRFEKFSTIPKSIANRLQNIVTKHYNYNCIIDYSKKYGNLSVLLVANNKVEKYTKNKNLIYTKYKLKRFNSPLEYTNIPYRDRKGDMKALYTLFKSIYSSNDKFYFDRNTNDPLHNKMSYKSLYRLIGHPNYGSETKKQLASTIIQFKCNNNQNKMKDNNIRLVELFKYNTEAGQQQSKIQPTERKVIKFINTDVYYEYFNKAKKFIFDFIRTNYVNYKDQYELTQDILTINNEKYVIGSANFLEEDKILEENIIETIDCKELKKANINHIVINENTKKEERYQPLFLYQNKNGKDIHTLYNYLCAKEPNSKYEIPPGYLNEKKESKKPFQTSDINKQQKEFNKKKKNIKPGAKEKDSKKEYYDKLYKERINEKRPEKTYNKNLRKPGQTEPKDTVKVCCMELATGKVFRGRKERVEKLVASEKYIYCAKKFWKSQSYVYDENHKKVIVNLAKGVKFNEKTKQYDLPEYNKNITKSPKGAPLGHNKQRKQLKQEEKMAMARVNFRGHRIKIDKQYIVEKADKDGNVSIKVINHLHKFKNTAPNPIQQVKQSAKDKKTYEHSLKSRKKKQNNPCRNRTHRAYEVMFMTSNAAWLYKEYVKAMSEKEANDKAARILKSRLKNNHTKYDLLSFRLTGNIKDWIPSLGNNREWNNKI